MTDASGATATFVVAGNGTTLERIIPGTILESDTILRTNNFFFEPVSFVGKRVDLAVMGGDPRVAPFMFETLFRSRHRYDLRAWTALNPKVVTAGKRRFAAQFQPFPWRDDRLRAEVEALTQQFGRKPMTGTHALLAAYGMGARRIILAGLDHYAAPRRYPFQLGPNHRALMARSINPTGIDEDQHDQRLDLAILALLQARGDIEVCCASESMAWSAILPLAPLRDGPTVTMMPCPDAPTDWASNVGLYHIAMLRMLRWGSRILRNFGRGGLA